MNGLNKAFNSKKVAWKIDASKSYVRLMSPNNAKLGGGLRVKSIKYYDNWASMTPGTLPESEYGVEYTYNDASGNSYGVAEFEPTLGNEENPFRQPLHYQVENHKYPDDFLYMSLPYCESHFPSPSIGYSKVEVKSIGHTSVNQNTTGHNVYEYYTAKDFPVINRSIAKSVESKSRSG